MDKNDFKVEACDDKCLDQISRFIENLGSINTINLNHSKRYLSWKYKNFQEPSHIRIIKKNERIVGMIGVMGDNLFTPHGESSFVWGCDVFVLPKYRKMPITHFLVSHEEPSSMIKMTFPINKRVSLYFERLEYIPLDLYNLCLKIRNNVDYNLSLGKTILRKIDFFGEEVDNLFNRTRRQYNYICFRNCKKLNWRYASHPYNKYISIVVKEDEEIMGYIVLRKDEKANVGYILDILGDLNRKRYIFILLLKAIEYFKSENIKYVSCLLSHPDYIDIFRKIGFLVKKREFCLFKGKNAYQNSIFLKSKVNFHLTMGDGDFRGCL